MYGKIFMLIKTECDVLKKKKRLRNPAVDHERERMWCPKSNGEEQRDMWPIQNRDHDSYLARIQQLIFVIIV